MKAEISENKKAEESRKVMIAVGSSRQSLKWKNTEIAYCDLIDRLKVTTRTRETFQEYKKLPKSNRDEIKDVGGFVGGALKQGRRKAENLANRSLITLDLDSVNISTEELWDNIVMLNDFEIVMYSTHSHSPNSPRLRLIIPLDRNVLPDEYQAISRKLADDIGIDMFDDTTYEPIRLMYWPSTSADGEFIFKRQEGLWLDPDTILDSYLDWKDSSFWPVSSRQGIRIQSEIKKQEDPLEKKGVIGAFCRSYSIDEVIETFLSDVYTPAKMAGRYTYTEGSTVGGLVVYEDKFAYSHHGTDPISGMLCNAFDLVRIHKYRYLDEHAGQDTPANKMPSYLKMLDTASENDRVKEELGREKMQEVLDDFEFDEVDTAWLKKLDYDRKGILKNTIDNAVIILDNDPRVAGKMIYNEFSNRAIITGKLPWTDHINRDWNDDDDAGVRYFLEHKYGLSGAGKIADAVSVIFQRHRIHPVRDYLNSLTWDGKERLETLLIDYLGAEDSHYTKAVTRTHLVAGVARIMRPGIKYDTMLVLTGPQGIGKSTLIHTLGREWFSDSLSTVSGKEAYEQLQGVWLIEMGELTATKKAEIEATKLFLSKSEDVYRAAYGRRTNRYKRQCIFFGTSNDREFLRDKTGDRRSWPVDCYVQLPMKDIFTDLPDEVDQIWAEAVTLYKKGHMLILDDEAAKEALEKQKEHSEESPKTGMIIEYLDRLYPNNWEDMDLNERRAWLSGNDDFDTIAEEAELRKDRTCVMEIWCELFRGDPKQLTPILSREINDILRGLEGWEKVNTHLRFGKIYGKQRGFRRLQNF